MSALPALTGKRPPALNFRPLKCAFRPCSLPALDDSNYCGNPDHSPANRVTCPVCGPVFDGYHKAFSCRLANGGLRCALGWHSYRRADDKPGHFSGLKCRRCPVESWLPIPQAPRRPQPVWAPTTKPHFRPMGQGARNRQALRRRVPTSARSVAYGAQLSRDAAKGNR